MKKLIAFVLGILFAGNLYAAGLPSGYTQVEWLEGGATSGAYIDLGYAGTLTMQTLLVASVNNITPSDALLFGATDAAGFVGGNPYAVDFFASKVMIPIGKYVSGTGARFTVTQEMLSGTVYNVKMNYPALGQFCVDDNCVTATPESPVSSNNLYLFGLHSDTGYSTQYSAKAMRVYSLTNWDNGVKIHDFVPARNSSGVLGMYDLMDNNPATAFHTNAGTGTFTAGRELDGCRNLVNPANIVNGSMSGANIIESSARVVTRDFIPVTAGQKYTVSVYNANGNTDSAFTIYEIYAFDQNGNKVATLRGTEASAAQQVTITVPNDAANIRFSIKRTDGANFSPSNVRVQLESGSTATNYVPYSAACHPTSCKNLFDESNLQNAYWTDTPSSLTQNQPYYRVASLNLPAGTYTFSTNYDETRILRIWVNGRKTELPPLADNKYTFTVTQPGLVSVNFRGPTTTSELPSNLHVQIEEGSTATTYTPYSASCGTCTGNLATYDSATGTVVQNGTPTPTNPVYPIFYTQGKITLRRVGDIADSYDATTGKITRRIGEWVIPLTAEWSVLGGNVGVYNTYYISDASVDAAICSHYVYAGTGTTGNMVQDGRFGYRTGHAGFWFGESGTTTQETFRDFIRQQAEAGTPVTIWYVLKTPVEETVGKTWCDNPLKIATTKYNTTAFSGVVTALNNAVDTIKTVVSNTINQATAVANLQSGKQRRPDESCPAGKTCLLVEDMNGDPHWYEIVESSLGVLPSGYTRLQYINFGGASYINTGLTSYKNTDVLKTKFRFADLGDTVFITFQNPSSGVPNVGLFQSGGAIYYQYSAGSRLASSISVNTDYTCETSNGYMVLAGTRFNGTADSEFTVSSPLVIGTAFNSTADSRMFKGRIYYYRYEDKNGNVLFDGIPAQYGNAVGLYDTVSGNFLTSATSTSVTAGPVVQ